MVAYKYDIIDGQRVEKNVAVEYRKLAADFKRETGLDLHVSSGVRTEAEQLAGWKAYQRGETNGVKWALPRESSHCEVGPSGPRALDLRDSGKDEGVTVKGSKRWLILKRLGAKYGFTWGGWGVPANEGWHWENHKVKVGVYPKPAAPASSLKSNQRRATILTNRRAKPTSKSTLKPSPLKKGTVGNFVGYTHGERVSGNDIWFKGISGDWFWSGGLGGPNTSGLKKL